jgi:hypothetical protein
MHGETVKFTKRTIQVLNEMLVTYTAVPFIAVLSTAPGAASQDGCRRFSRHSCSLRYSYKLNDTPYFADVEF